jgi:diguanylate cyclase (GGDEF)-like protein
VAKPRFDSDFPRNADGEASGDQREAHVTQTSQPPSTGFGLTIVKIALVMLSVEILIMLGFNWFGVQLLGWRLALVDAGLLAVIVATIAYFAFIRPKDRQIRAIMASLEEARRNAENLARFDALTGVLSRRALLEALDVEVARAKRYGSALACLMLDLDHFKAINDNYGHPFGDRVLHLIARVISEHCRPTDYLGRYGGEEFLIVLPETRIDGATTLAERVRSAVAETSLGQNDERITLSIGVAEWRDGDGSTKRLIAQADRALLKAKSAGRNRILTSQPA